MLINIRGTNGSGKSTLVRKLFALSDPPSKELHGMLGPKRAEANRLHFEGVKKPVFILGPYHTAAGGCDQIRPYDAIFELLEKYRTKGHVIFEGVIISSAIGRIGAYMAEAGPKQAAMVFLSTPLSKCLEHIQMRRDAAAHNHRADFNRKQVEDKYRTIQKYKERLRNEGRINIIDASVEESVTLIPELMR